jgi:intracellular septation protein
MHAVFEYLPLFVFFALYKLVDIYWATASLIVISVLQIAYYYVSKKPIPKRTWIFFVLITIFGGLTIYMHDDTFLKWKVTIINVFFGVALVTARYLFSNNIIKQFLQESLELPEKIWDKLNLSWAAFFVFCGVLNWYVAFNFAQETWVNFKVFGLTGLTFVFAISSVFSLSKYLPSDDEPTDKKTKNSPSEK